MKKCSSGGCQLKTYGSTEKCILHCEENKSDFYKIRFEFYEALRKYLETKGSQDYFCLERFIFPRPDTQSSTNYLKLLHNRNLHFKDCIFLSNNLDIESAHCFFDNCTFNNYWSVHDVKVLENTNGVLYQQCEFNGSVNAYTSDRGSARLESPLFNDCTFNDGIEFYNTTFASSVFKNTNTESLTIKSLKIENCTFEEKFKLNKCLFESVLFKDSFFEKKVEFKNNTVQTLRVTNTNFKNLADFYKSTFGDCFLFKSIFEGFVGFEKCKFGECSASAGDKPSTFKYVTFLNFLNFRSATFKTGLDIETVNLNEAPNFLNATVEKRNSSRETFRIIKSSFDKINNYIEANKYFALEMSKYREELKGKPLTQEKLVFFLNEKFSNFGQSYLRPLLWMLCTSMFHFFVVKGYENNTLYTINSKLSELLAPTFCFINQLAVNILPFSKFLKSGMEALSILFYIVYASLVWLIIVAIKRHTKR